MYSEESDQYLSSDSLSDVEKDLRSPLNGWGVPSDAEPGNDPTAMSRKGRRRIVASSDEEEEENALSDNQSDYSGHAVSPRPNNGHTRSSQSAEYLDPELYCLRRSGRTSIQSQVPKVRDQASIALQHFEGGLN